MEVLLAYGGRCVCCGEWRYEFLSMDHINNDGAAHRKELGINRTNAKPIYAWLKKNNYPSGFQVLCMNCNFAKGHYGQCIHELENEVRNLMEAV